MMTKSVGTVLLEATVIGVGFVAVGLLASRLIMSRQAISSEKGKLAAVLFVSGAAFHIILEYTGLNAWYSTNYVAAQNQRSGK